MRSVRSRSLLAISAVAIVSAPACSRSHARHDDPGPQAWERTCGDRFCEEGDLPFACREAEHPADAGSTEGNPLCLWSGSTCVPLACGYNSDEGSDFPACPDGSACELREDGPGVCVRSDFHVDDRMRCLDDGDCAPEPCCRPAMCVTDGVCRTHDGCCACRDCRPCISACRCVDGCCIAELDGGGCC